MTRIAIIGNGLAGRLGALYFARQIPGAEITLVDPENPDKPIVGESTVEVTAQFMKSLGLGTYLEENHKHKYGLTYYFKLPQDADDPDAPEYILHEAPGVVRLPAYNLNRHLFDAELKRRMAPHVTQITGKVTDVAFGDGPGALQPAGEHCAMMNCTRAAIAMAAATGGTHQPAVEPTGRRSGLQDPALPSHA